MQTKKHFTYIFLFALIFWSSIVGVMYIVMAKQEQKKAEEIALSASRAALIQDKIFRLWGTSHGGFYVPVSKKTPPNPSLAHIPNRDLYVNDMNLTLMNPAYALRQMMNDYRGIYGLKGHLTSLKLLNKNNAPDDWERGILEGMEDGAKVEQVHIFTQKDNKPILRMLEPLIINSGCLKCHAHQGYKVGDLRGGVTVILPMEEIYKKKDKEILNLIILHTLSWLLGLLFITYFYRKIIQALSEQEKLNDEIVDSEHFLRTIIDANSNLIVTTYGDRVQLMNQAVLDFTGYDTEKKFIKEHKCICDFFIEKESCLVQWIEEKNWIEYILSTPKINHQVCMKRGIDEHVFSVTAKQLDITGKAQYIVVFNDITELLHSKENLALAQHIAKTGHWELDLISNELYWSDEVYNIFGVDKNKTNSSLELFMEIIHPDDREIVNNTYKTSLEDKKEYIIVHRIVLRDSGKEKIVEEKCKHYFDDNGNVIRSLGTVQDITERKKLEIELQEKEEMMIAQSRHAAMGEMISMIAHQWRQPITVISMVANNLLADVEFEDVQPQNVKKSAIKVLEQSHHLSQTIDDFKNFFRPNKKTELSLVSDILEENFKIMGKSLENNNITVEKNYESHSEIETYSRELLQVFINILKNAKEALMENNTLDPTIFIATKEDNDNIYISICNNGEGIDPEIISKIYDPYFSTKDEKIGTGLGLYMTKTIIQKHLNGSIKAVNREDGVCFEISLPKKGVSNNE